jgi:NADH-quinone oxidoreductase subunit N
LIVLSVVTGLHNGFIAAIYFVYVYAITTNFIFLTYIVLRRVKRGDGISNIIDFTYFKDYNKTITLIFVIALLSVAGIPPLAGFFGKLYFFQSLIMNNEYVLFIILIILTIISCVYYIRLIRFLFFSDREEDYIVPYKRIPDTLIYCLVILFLINVFFIYLQAPMLYTIGNLLFSFYC